MDELKQLKSVLRSLVVSSPTQVDVRSLLRDYRNMMGAPLPIVKYGYRDPLEFLRERFADCFLFQGAPSNPVLTLIVPDTLKHIDKFVQSQRTPKANTKFKGKRRSVPDSILGIPPPRLLPNLDSCQTRTAKPAHTRISPCKEPAKQEAKPKIPEPPGRPEPPPVTPKTLTDPKPITNLEKTENKENERHSGGNYSRLNLENFLRKRSALYTSQQLETESYNDDCTEKNTSDSGRQTASSSSSSKRMQFEELKEEVLQLILDRPEGVWCMELMKLYREQYQRELNFMRYGYTSVVSFACALAPRVRVSPPTDSGDCLVRDATRPAPRPPPRPLTRAPPRAHHASAREPPLDADDALPGVHFDPDVFPSDCMHFMESIPVESISLMSPGDMVEVMVGEVYSPSHLWLIRLGEQYNIAMEDMMDEMTEYYNKGEGKNRTLALGAVQVGHYCSSVYENDWHRSLIVKIVDSDTVKVRHVDYGTVDTVAVRTLKPLLRRWSSPPAQALRARLAALRPPAAGRRWAPAAAAALLRRVRDKRLVACVANIDHEEDILEVFLIDTSTEKEQCISEDLIRSGYADPRHDSALKVSSDTDSDELDLRSLVTTLSQFRSDLSDVSASASEVVGREPRRLPTWECEKTDAVSSHCVSTPKDWECEKDDASVVSSVRISRLRALHRRLNDVTPDDTDAESVVTVTDKVVDEMAQTVEDDMTSLSGVTNSLLKRKISAIRELHKWEKDSSSGSGTSVVSVTSELLRRRRALFSS